MPAGCWAEGSCVCIPGLCVCGLSLPTGGCCWGRAALPKTRTEGGMWSPLMCRKGHLSAAGHSRDLRPFLGVDGHLRVRQRALGCHLHGGT